MEKGNYLWGRKRSRYLLSVERGGGDEGGVEAVEGRPNKMPPPPETPEEPMEFLSRAWSVSASDLSNALLASASSSSSAAASDNTMKNNPVADCLPDVMIPASSHRHHHRRHRPFSAVSSIITHHPTISKWFHHRESHKTTVKKKEKVRAERARIHAAVSVAGVAAAVAAVAAGASSVNQSSKMNVAMASATQLLASHCIEIAELAGADHDHVSSALRSAVDVRTAGDLITLTAAAATALRGAAALSMRVQREARSTASVIPYERVQCGGPDIWCKEGELLYRTRDGTSHWKRVYIYINRKSQVIVKLKSKHIGGALSKKQKSVVYGVCDDEGGEDKCYFGLRTAQGLLEFECENKNSKQKWVDGVQNLLRQVTGGPDQIEQTLGLLKLD